jgi:cobalt-zinc-cadmium resistance protein CzcA
MPMAISTSAGSEVQRPLATAVIGGMVSSTLLGLSLLPALLRVFLTAKGRSTPSTQA